MAVSSADWIKGEVLLSAQIQVEEHILHDFDTVKTGTKSKSSQAMCSQNANEIALILIERKSQPC